MYMRLVRVNCFLPICRLIDVSEITNALRTLGEPIDEDDINEMIKLGEKDKNNQISLYGLFL